MVQKRRFKLDRRWYLLYAQVQRRLRGIPRPGTVDWGGLRRLEPISRHFGTDRGLAIDRYYIEAFLARNSADVHGRVLEIGDRNYTVRYGQDRVTHSDILHVSGTNPLATIVGDLADAPHIPDGSFDTIILTQTLQFIYDTRAAVRTLHRILKPGGVLLLTAPGLSPVPTQSVWGYTWHWAFTALSLERLLAEAFGRQQVNVETTGNVLAATAFLQGLATEELAHEELDATDPDYPVILTARVRKPAAEA